MELDLYTYQRILDYGQASGVRLMLTCKRLYHGLIIRVLPWRAGWEQSEIESYVLRNIEEAQLTDDCKVVAVSHFKKLRSLSLFRFSLSQDEMSKLDLEELRVYGTRRFTDLSHMANLRKLTIESNEIFPGELSDQRIVENLTWLEKLILIGTNVDDLSNLRNLKSLTVYWNPYLGDSGLRNLDLEKLYTCGTERITDVGHMGPRSEAVLKAPPPFVPKLRKLSVMNESHFTQDCLTRLNLETLVLPARSPRYKLDHMSNLRELYAPPCFTQEDIARLNVRRLGVSNCPGITSVNHMDRLRGLYARGTCGIGDDGIKNVNLVILRCDNNPRITSVNHMGRLERLSARGWSGIDNEGIRGVNLKWLDISGNRKVTEYGHMTRLIRVVNYRHEHIQCESEGDE